MLFYFLTIAVLGIISIVKTPGILHAFNPYWAVMFFVTDPLPAFLALGAVVLAVTGAEALYADMGHFGRSPIRVSWLAFVLPALMMNSRSEEPTSELQSLMRTSYDVFCLKTKKSTQIHP